GLLALSLTATAEARCRLPALQVLWSYPAAGAVDVPTNAELWALVPYAWTNPVVRLDGQVVAYTVSPDARGVVHVLPGALQPNHDHVLTLDFTQVRTGQDAGVNAVTELAFRTGASSASAPAAPTLGQHTVTEPLYYDLNERVPCPDVLHAQDCLDTGPNTLHTWEVAGPTPLAWQVGEHVIPARCSVPQVLNGVGGRFTGRCLPVRAIGAGGLVGAATEVCIGPERTPDAPGGVASRDAGVQMSSSSADASVAPARSTDDGCSVVRGGGMGWTLLALLRRRRRR
ncbi:MAG: hypothetical protein ABW352_08295, partial [Polyangiales bacterium]